MAQSPAKKNINPDEMIASALAVYATATKADVADGVAWYGEAGDLAADLAAGVDGVTADMVAGVISAMSPRMPWGRNKIIAREIVARFADGGVNADYSGLGITANVKAAINILAGSPVDAELKNKRLAFYANIAGDKSRATIDSWMMKVLFGQDTEFVSPGSYYAACENAIIAAADMVGLSPADFQAATWVAIRRVMLTETQHAAYEA